ncbi:hypothetical protein GCM10028783_19310 [Modestobacter muralis]
MELSGNRSPPGGLHVSRHCHLDPADRRVRALALTEASLRARQRVQATLQDCLHAAGLDGTGQRSLLALLRADRPAAG